ncbi:MAG: sigma-54 dependent transcriptional regulator [Acidobacteriaceae bacterium]
MENIVTAAGLLIVSRDSGILRPTWDVGQSNGWLVEIAGDVWEVMDKLRAGAAPDVMLFDLTRGNVDGVEGLRRLRRMHPAAAVIVIDHEDNRGRRELAYRLGAREYLVTPLAETQLQEAVARNLPSASDCLEENVSSDNVEQIDKDRFFVGFGPAMQKLRAQVAMLAEADVPVFISGEPGSGRETVARLLHALSIRSGFPFARIDCAALPEDLLEREMFGYTARSSAGPGAAHRGKLEKAAKGRIFLDGIAELPLRLQSRLAEALQSGEFVRPGSSERVGIDVAVVACASTSMDQALAEHRLHADLCRYLSVYEVRVPSLRERREEVPFLSRHLMHRFARSYGLPPRDLSASTAELWQSYQWPGNLCELEQMVKRYLVVGDEMPAFVEPALDEPADEAVCGASKKSLRKASGPATTADRTGMAGHKSLRSLLQSVREQAERSAIATALEETGWNRKAAARLLRISYRSVLYKIEQYQMSSSDRSSFPASGGSGSRRTRHNGAGQSPAARQG